MRKSCKNQKKTLLVDLDPQSNATRGCGVDPHSLNYSINDALLGKKRDRAMFDDP